MKYENLPDAGQKIIGKHILGKSYSGFISSRRPYYGNNEQIHFDITFDEPTVLGENDVREAICITADWPLKGDKKWQDGNGGWFEVV